MSIERLVDLIHSSTPDPWADLNGKAFEALFGAPDGRYPKAARETVTLRAPEMSADSGVRFAAYIHPSNPSSGRYSGLSFVIFPTDGAQCLIGMVVGTNGLAPDEAILGRPGHARKVQAICRWLDKKFGNGRQIAWAKQDPTRTDIRIPELKDWSAYKPVFDRYGEVMYALFRPSDDRHATDAAVTAFLDLLFEERGHYPLKQYETSAKDVQSGWLEHLMPTVNRNQVRDFLSYRRYVILQGPPGTGKTMLASQLLREDYAGFGKSIQFHPNTTYESFIGGLAPSQSPADLGLRFLPTPGFLMDAAGRALRNPDQNYLLHIDEINRADLTKILGEAIFLLEPTTDYSRMIELAYDFGEPFHQTFHLPTNLHILGTMNSADRSIAVVDVAVRRRFAFLSMWPRISVVEKFGCPQMVEAFQRLVTIFVEHATDDSFLLMPGHSYFLEANQTRAKQKLRMELVPLLEEYLAQGYVTGFAEQIRSYLQWLASL